MLIIRVDAEAGEVATTAIPEAVAVATTDAAAATADLAEGISSAAFTTDSESVCKTWT